MQAEKRQWRELRGVSWGATIYRGLYLPGGPHGILISKLSHGLRVIEIKHPTRYKFDPVSNPSVKVSERFVVEATRALAADKRLQAQIGEEYDRLLDSD